RQYDAFLCPDVVMGEDSDYLGRLAFAREWVLMEWGTTTLLLGNSGDGEKTPSPQPSPLKGEGEMHRGSDLEEAPLCDRMAAPSPFRGEGWGEGVSKPAQDTSSPHELDRTVRFLQAAGFEGIKSRQDIWPETYVTAEERACAAKEIEELRSQMPGAYVVAVCAGARFKQKDWGVANFIELFSRLAQAKPLFLVLLGSDVDKPASDTIEKDLGGIKGVRVLNKSGRTGLYDAIALIEQADICLGNDTFGLHAAIAVGTPSVVMMWGGDSERWAPWGDPAKHRMVRSRDQSCFGCRGECPWPKYRCMTSIRVEDVMAEVHDLAAEFGINRGEMRPQQEKMAVTSSPHSCRSDDATGRQVRSGHNG
ncbi:MAG: glycosyltransferase family 9 protein, partial [bacterium]